MASPHGGVNIEEVAQETPSEIFKEGVDIITGMKFIHSGNPKGIHNCWVYPHTSCIGEIVVPQSDPTMWWDNTHSFRCISCDGNWAVYVWSGYFSRRGENLIRVSCVGKQPPSHAQWPKPFSVE